MSNSTETPSLANLEYQPYLTTDGYINEDVVGKIGVYAIFDRDRSLVYVGYSRDVRANISHDYLAH